MTDTGESPEPSQSWVVIGKLGGLHGIRGELRLFSLSDVPDRFEGLKEVWWLGPRQKSARLQISSLRAGSSFYLIQFAGFTTREAAAGFCHGHLAVDQSQRGALPSGTYFCDDVIGLSVLDETGQSLGRIQTIYRTGANDVYEVGDGEKTFLLPAVPSVILKIDLAAGHVQVRLP
jgi:16S rRNA processing protein RimM